MKLKQGLYFLIAEILFLIAMIIAMDKNNTIGLIISYIGFTASFVGGIRE